MDQQPTNKTKKREFYKKEHDLLAQKHHTRLEIVSYIRRLYLSKPDYGITEFTNFIEEKIAYKQKHIENLLRAKEKRQAQSLKNPEKKELNKKIAKNIDIDLEATYKKKAFYLDVYTFIHRVGDEAWSDVTKKIDYSI